MRRILFVDDEQNVLDALKNLFWRHRREIQIVATLGGEAALEELSKGPFDAIVSDMRMPGMDGAALLQRVKEEYPGMVRIILSGHSEKEAIFRGLPFAHQFLGKPCDASQLCSVIERVYRLQALLNNESLRKALGHIERLPSLPRTFHQLMEATMQPDTSLETIADIVQEDPAMTAKLLQLVNSAAFGTMRTIESIDQAVVYLGIETIRSLTLTLHMFDAAAERPAPGFSPAVLQEHAILTARVAQRLAPSGGRVQNLFAAALLHDIGYVILAHCDPASFTAVVDAARDSKRPIRDVEKEMLGVTHAEIGAYLLGLWGLPHPIVEGVAFHHDPAALAEGVLDVPAVLHIADALVNELSGDSTVVTGHDTASVEYLHTLNVASELPKWRRIVEEEVSARRGSLCQ
jgi:HD-like signal output (HDOD) protein